MGGTVHHRDRSTELEGKEVSFGMSAGATSEFFCSGCGAFKPFWTKLMVGPALYSRKARLFGSQDCRRDGRFARPRQELPE